MGNTASLPWLASLPFLAALALAVIPNARARLAAWTAGLTALGGLALLLALAPSVFAGNVLHWSVEWLPELGLKLGFRLDGLAWMFALLILGIGALVVLYAAYYLGGHEPRARFYGFFMLFMGAMLGVVMADNLILLVVFWELTSLSSFLLIGFWHADPSKGQDAREGARMALTITGGGGLCLLAGVLVLGHIVGSTDLDQVLASGAIIRSHPLYTVALVLVLLGAFTKSAQFPFHFWLPHAMAAPTPVSAYLHSATMVKAGVFLLARFYPVLGGSPEWFWLVSLTGLATLMLGAYIALFQQDLKGLLAYSTISHLGLITLLFGLDEPLAVVAAVFHILNHATFKASLFMAAGIIDHETGSRDMRKLNGLWKYMPWTATLAMVASASMAGVPLMNGFLSKEMFFAETLTAQTHFAMEWILPLGATVGAAFSVAYSLRFIHDVFFNGEPVGLDRVPHAPPFFMQVPVAVLVVLCLAVGILPAVLIGPLLAVAAKAALLGPTAGELPAYSLAVFHGWNLPLLMSTLALLGGIVIYISLQRRVNLHTLERAPITPPRDGRSLFFAALRRVINRAAQTTLGLQSGRFQHYLLALVVLAVSAGTLPFLNSPSQAAASVSGDMASLPFIALWSLGVAATVAVVWAHAQRLLAIVLMGAVGLVVSLAFVHFSAPDLALTQLLVEVATITLLMLALRWLPDEGQDVVTETRAVKSRDALIALAAGAGVAALCWMVLGRPMDSISPYFLETAQSLGGGANAVNVIIVDYRGLDTLGEITVMGIAALLIHALLADWMPPRLPWQPPVAGGLGHPMMLALVSRLLLPLLAMVSVYFYLRGHNLPGGGFIAGLLLALALMLQVVANGQAYVGQRMSLEFTPWIGWGLLLAGACGMGSWFFGAPFMTTTYDYPVAPWLGSVPLASAAVFDLGVYLVVVGGALLALLSLARIGRVATGEAGGRQ